MGGAPLFVGDARFEGVAPGRYRVAASLEGGAFSSPTALARVGAGEVVSAELTLTQAQGADAAVGVTGRARLQGRADDLSHGRILVYAQGLPLTQLTAPDGSYALTGLLPGEPVTLGFQSDGYGVATLQVPPLGLGETRRLDDVILSANPGEVRGTITLNQFSTEDALRDASVTLLSLEGAPVGAQGQREGGAFAIIGVPAGEYRLRASAVGYEAVERAVRVIEGEVRTENVALNHESLTAARVLMTGRVTLDGARDYAGTAVRVRIAGREVPFAAAATDRDGTFALFASPSERYRVDFEQAGWQPALNVGPYRWDAARVAFIDDAGRALERALASEPFEGRVTVGLQFADAWVQAGGYANSADVRLVGRDTREVRSGVTTVATPAEFIALPPDLYDVTVERRGFETFTTTATVTRLVAEVPVDATLRLKRLADAGFVFSGRTVSASDLCGLDLTFTDFAGARLCGDFSRGANCGADPEAFSFTSSRLSGADFTQCAALPSFRGVDFSYATLFSADLTRVDFTDASFYAANLTNASLRETVLSDAARVAPENLPDPCEGDEARRRGQVYAGGRPETGGDGAVQDDGLKADLRDAVLAGADLTDAVLSGLDLRATEFGGVLLVGAQLESACLRGTRLALTDLSRANLRGADARGIVMANSVLQETDLRGADLRDASLLSAVLDRTLFGCQMVEANDPVTPEDERGLCRCPAEPLDAVLDPTYDDLPRDGAARGCRTRLNRAAMNGVNIVGADFSGADLSDTGLTGIEIGDAQSIDAAGGRVVISSRFQEARFDGANLAGVAWNTANLTRATLRGANLSNAQFFENSTYDNIVLTGADLSNTVLAGLDLRGWDLQSTTLLETDLRGADARYVSFDGATIDGPLIDDAQLRGASFEGVKVMRTFDPRLAAERRAERAAALADPDAFDPLGPDVTLEGISFRGAHFIGGDISWMESIAGLILDDASIGGCGGADDGGPATRPVYADDLEIGRDFGASEAADASSEDAAFNLVGASLRGVHGADLDTGLTCGVQWWRILNARAGNDVSRHPEFHKSDVSRARFSLNSLVLVDSLAEGATFEFDLPRHRSINNPSRYAMNHLTSLRSQLSGANIAQVDGAGQLTLDIRLSDLSGAEFSGSHLRGVIERSVIQGAELNSRAGLLAQWRGMEFRMLDFTDTAPPRDLRVFYDRGGDPWSDRALIADSFVPPGTTVDISEWKGVEVVRTDLRGVALRVTADPVELPETTTSRVITLANCPMRGLTLSTPANGAVPTVLDLESVDVRPLAAGALALRNPNDLVTYWRVRGGDVLEGGALDDALSALPAGQRRSVAGPLLLPFPDGFDRGLADARVRGLCAPDPTGATCHIPLPPERAGAFPVLTGATLASLAGLDPGEWEGANLSEATLGAAAGAPVALALEAGSTGISGDSAGAWGSVEAASTRTGLSFAGSTLRNVAVTLQRGAGGAQVFSALNLVGATLGAGFSWQDATPPSAVTLGRATVDPSAVLRGCVDCSAHGARSGAGAEVSGAGLAGLLSTAAHLDLSQADLVARVGEPLVLEPAEGVSLIGARLDGRTLFGPLPSAAPVALWGASLSGGVVGGHVLLAGATGDAVTLRNSLEGAVFGRHGLNISRLELTAHLTRAILWDAVGLASATILAPDFILDEAWSDETSEAPRQWFSLRRAILRDASLPDGMDVVGADLRCADFRRFHVNFPIRFRHVNLDFADFRGADMRLMNFSDVSARYLLVDEDTQLPGRFWVPPGQPLPSDLEPSRRSDLSFMRGAVAANIQGTTLTDQFAFQTETNRLTGRFDRPDRVPFPNCAQSP